MTPPFQKDEHMKFSLPVTAVIAFLACATVDGQEPPSFPFNLFEKAEVGDWAVYEHHMKMGGIQT